MWKLPCSKIVCLFPFDNENIYVFFEDALLFIGIPDFSFAYFCLLILFDTAVDI